MRLEALEFASYPPGVTDFAQLLATTDQPNLFRLGEILTAVADQVANPVPNRFFSLIVAGHSDRQDRADMSCDERRTSEAEAAQGRAVSAWEWVKGRVVELVSVAGIDAGEWWESSPQVTWGLVFAGAGMLKFPEPTPDERLLNRRVVVLVSQFEPGAA